MAGFKPKVCGAATCRSQLATVYYTRGMCGCDTAHDVRRVQHTYRESCRWMRLSVLPRKCLQLRLPFVSLPLADSTANVNDLLTVRTLFAAFRATSHRGCINGALPSKLSRTSPFFSCSALVSLCPLVVSVYPFLCAIPPPMLGVNATSERMRYRLSLSR